MRYLPATASEAEEDEMLAAFIRALGRGREFAVTAAEIGRHLGLEADPYNRVLRRIATRGIVKGFPICSDGTGFFLAVRPADLREYARSLDARAFETLARSRRVRDIADSLERNPGGAPGPGACARGQAPLGIPIQSQFRFPDLQRSDEFDGAR